MNPLLLLCLGLVTPLPQYGGGGSLQSLQPPAHSSSSVQCRTEQQTIWDTQYVESETQECETIRVPKCSTQYRSQCKPVQRQECNTQYKDELEYYTETECNTDYKQDCEYRWEGSG